MTQPNRKQEELNYCSLWRRLGAIVYDTILLICLIFIAWQPVPLLPESLSPFVSRAIRLGYMISICFVFFGWFWCHGGQTLGMRAWKIRIVDAATLGSISWRAAWLRFIMALVSWLAVGCGFLFSLFHPKRQTWHDSFSGTILITED